MYFAGFPFGHIGNYLYGLFVQSITYFFIAKYPGVADLPLFIYYEGDHDGTAGVVIDRLLRIIEMVVDIMVEGALATREFGHYFRITIDPILIFYHFCGISCRHI